MNFTFNIGELIGLGAVLIYVGASFESLRRLNVSVANLGARLQVVEKVQGDQVAVENVRERVRTRTAAAGIVIREDDI